ncbi:MAG TPA: hypothetical protein VNJ12_08490, partial [Candidatus Dormibacteraeota bacterium]|nr:hypothetical protein [Candidatus Dormibacteraeota bacterium]
GTLLLLFWAAWEFRHVSDPANSSFDLEFSLATVAALLASYHLFVHELTPLIVTGFLIRSFSVLFIVLLGLMVWLSQEIEEGRKASQAD